VLLLVSNSSIISSNPCCPNAWAITQSILDFIIN
jgi:hypothetical protein